MADFKTADAMLKRIASV
jgi:hypothetical protein